MNREWIECDNCGNRYPEASICRCQVKTEWERIREKYSNVNPVLEGLVPEAQAAYEAGTLRKMPVDMMNSVFDAKPSQAQVSGNHYKDMVIQPAEFCQLNELNWCESNAVKYVCRHRNKNGVEDIRKAIHYLEMLIEWEYS